MNNNIKKFGFGAVIIACFAFFTACEPELKPIGGSSFEVPSLPSSSFEYTTFTDADGIVKNLESVNSSASDITNGSATLGRVLFYDKRLSINNVIACASCHKQELAFADNVNFSGGFGGKITLRNSMAIINPLSQGSMFWDSRASDAKELSLMPVFNHIEMGMESDDDLINKLKNTTFYAQLFKDAFGTEEISKQKISTAIAHFLNSMQHSRSKFDIGKNSNFSNFTSLEKLGKDIFFSDNSKCSRCHGNDNFLPPDQPGSGYNVPEVKGTANIGLDVNFSDNGMKNGQFKIPSLRNIALTGPYMHDGRFKTLEEVINHYSSGIKNHPNLDANLKTGAGPVRLNFTENENAALVAFLKTLTDTYFISDPKYSNPFKK